MPGITETCFLKKKGKCHIRKALFMKNQKPFHLLDRRKIQRREGGTPGFFPRGERQEDSCRPIRTPDNSYRYCGISPGGRRPGGRRLFPGPVPLGAIANGKGIFWKRRAEGILHGQKMGWIFPTVILQSLLEKGALFQRLYRQGMGLPCGRMCEREFFPPGQLAGSGAQEGRRAAAPW